MTRSNDLPSLVLRSIREQALLSRGDRVLVALSGGPDSVALLLLLRSLRGELGIELRAAHLDHGLRGRESAGDAAFCRRFARSLDVPLTCGKADVGKYAKSRRLSLETAAREVRKKFLTREAQRQGCAVVATAHTRDDQAETVLLHLLRGAGLSGLAGIPRRNGPFVRPLLDVGKQELLQYLQGRAVPYREDSSNRSDGPTRNRVRLRLLPELRRFNPQITRSLAALADTVSSDLQLIADSTRVAYERCATASKSQISIDLSCFKLYNTGLKRNIIRHAIQRLTGPGAVPDYQATAQALALVKSGRTGARLELLPGIWIAVSYGAVIITKGRPAAQTAVTRRPGAGVAALEIPGVLDGPGYGIIARLVRRRGLLAGALDRPDTAYFDWDALSPQRLTVGCRRPGERVAPFGGARPKKITDYMIDAKLPRAARAAWPVIRAGGTALWIPRVRRSSAAPVTATTKHILRLEFTPHAA